MRIITAGGGSGGHVTPVLAVINELSKNDPHLKVWFICDRGFAAQTRDIMKRSDAPVKVKVIFAGKLRRYFGIPWWQQLLHIPTTLRNIRDIFLLSLGFIQSLYLLARIKPDAVFTKGGFVCLPVGLAAKALRIPLIIHDSEAQPGLTNRILARFATAITTGAPLDDTPYPADISYYVGIPVRKEFKPADDKERAHLKRQLGYKPDKPLVFITGGGTGAARINEAAAFGARELTKYAQVVHLTGAKRIEGVRDKVANIDDYHALPFVDKEMPMLARAADVVVTRAGATTLLELAACAAPTIIIPHPNLTGGHQLKNAAVYAERGAAFLLNDVDLKNAPELLSSTIIGLLENAEKRAELRRNIATLAKSEAARDVAEVIVSSAKRRVGE